VYAQAYVQNPLATDLSMTSVYLPSLYWSSSRPSGTNPQPCPISNPLGSTGVTGVSGSIGPNGAGCTSSVGLSYGGSIGDALDYLGGTTYYINIPSSSPSQLGLTIGSGYSVTVDFYYCGIEMQGFGNCP